MQRATKAEHMTKPVSKVLGAVCCRFKKATKRMQHTLIPLIKHRSSFLYIPQVNNTLRISGMKAEITGQVFEQNQQASWTQGLLRNNLECK